MTAALDASGTHEGRRSVGRPVQPGQVLNPNGHNQYTYRRKFEHAVERLLTGTGDEDAARELLKLIPEGVRPVVQKLGPDTSPGEALAVVTIGLALLGDEKARGEVLRRVWPAVEKHEHSGPNGASLTRPQMPDLSALSDDERATVLKLAHKAIQGGPPLVGEGE